MENIRQTVMDMLKTPQLASMATITLDGKPWARYIMILSDKDLNIRCAVFLNSRKIKQIEKNPEVHLTFGVNDPQNMKTPYVQIQAKARITTEKQDREDLWNDMLQPHFSGVEDPNYAVIIMEPYRIEFMKPGTGTPEVWEK